MRLVVLVDGEHYPPVTRGAIGRLRARGDDVCAAVFLGGSEKLREGDLEAAYGISVERGPDREALLGEVLRAHRPDAVVDLSDEPVVSAPQRFRLAAIALAHGARYQGPDFELRPVAFEQVLSKPAIRIVATGKRAGKTAVSGALARHAVDRGRRPVVVAMGRGGPDEPHVVEAGTSLGPADLLAVADAGRHAASDYLEDAVTAGVTTIGCKRVGGGLAGAPHESNVAAGARIAEARDEDLVILEGSGAAMPPIAAHAGLVCVPAGAPDHALGGYLGLYRLLLSDVAIVTMAEDEAPTARTASTIRRLVPRIEVVSAVLRPSPLTNVANREVFFCSTAPSGAGPSLRRHLEEFHGCEVAGMSHSLADRVSLEHDLGIAGTYEVLLTEVKGAAIDVAVRHALANGIEVVFADNALVGDGVGGAFDHLLDLASSRSTQRPR